METAMNSFTWRVAAGGYEWYNGPGPDDSILITPHLVPAGDWKTREYEPLKEYTGLFRTFAETPPTLEGILEFANQYGHLGHDARAPEGFPEDPNELYTEEDRDRYEAARRVVKPFEAQFDWEMVIDAVRECVEAWDRIQRREGNERLLESLRKRINHELGIPGRLRPCLAPNRVRGGLVLELEPSSLLGAIWLQLAQAVAGDKEYRACASCGRSFELSPDTMRADAVYCKEACRARAYRNRKETAVKLASKGKTPRQIAKELGSDVDTVKGWLARSKGK
jgi:hypothetical protein